MEQKPMPWAVKVILIVHSVMLIYIICIFLNMSTHLLPFLDPMSKLSEIEKPFYIFACAFWVFTVVTSIFGFLRARLYARNITLVFYGLLILYLGNFLLFPFTVKSLIGYRVAMVHFHLLLFCILIFLFYIALRPDVYNYCQPSD